MSDQVAESGQIYGYFPTSREKLKDLSQNLPVNAYALATILLRIANWRDKEWYDGRQMITVRRGQLVTSQESLLYELPTLSRQKIRTAIGHLLRFKFISMPKSNHHYSLITICDYESYCPSLSEPNQPITNHQPTDNQPITITKEYIRINKNKKKDIYTPLFIEFWEIYPRKESKKEAAMAWSKLTPEAIEQLLKVIRNGYTWNENPRFIPHPATWLNQERWKDVQRHAEKKPYDPADDPIAALARSKK